MLTIFSHFFLAVSTNRSLVTIQNSSQLFEQKIEQLGSHSNAENH